MGDAPADEEIALGPLFSGAGDLAPAPAPLPPAGPVLPGLEVPETLFMDRAALERYLRLTGAKAGGRADRAGKKPADDPAWIETLSNGRFLVCELGLRWHLAGTLAEARGVVERLGCAEQRGHTVAPK